ncbi:MAG TPA: hypothetical protein VJQ45_10450 [Ktedonobacterales bacterium]|nr:hypothetical protein [Ktedonobacterales bacterium]
MDTPDPTMAQEVARENPQDKSSGELGGLEAVEASDYAREHPLPFRTDGQRHFIPGAMHDQLVVAQGSAAGAARLSAAHVSRLLYNPDAIDRGLAPYDARYAANYAEATREPDQVEKR